MRRNDFSAANHEKMKTRSPLRRNNHPETSNGHKNSKSIETKSHEEMLNSMGRKQQLLVVALRKYEV